MQEGRREALPEGEGLGGKEKCGNTGRKYYTVGYDAMLSLPPFKVLSKDCNPHQWFALEFNVSVWPKDEKRTHMGATKGAQSQTDYICITHMNIRYIHRERQRGVWKHTHRVNYYYSVTIITAMRS